MIDLQRFHATFGKPQGAHYPDEKLLQEYTNVLPEALLEIWAETGFAHFRDGMLWIVDPTSLEDELRRWPDTPKAAVPVMRSAFGKIVYWATDQFTYLDVHLNVRFDIGDNTGLVFNLFLTQEKSLQSVLNQSLFRSALKKLGAIAADEMYAYALPIAMGGDLGIGNIEIVKMREQLAILAQING